MTLLVALGGALAAQTRVAGQPTQMAAWLAYAAATLLFALAAGRWQQRLSPQTEPAGQRPRPLVGLAALTVIAGATAASAAGVFPAAVASAWALGLLLALLAVRSWKVSATRVTEPASKLELAALAAILILAAAARFSWIETLPGRYFDDEARLGLYLVRPYQRITSYFNLGWNAWPVLGIVAQGWLGAVLGLSTTTLRLASATFGTLAVGTTYLAARQLFCARVALLAALLLAINRTAIDISRLGTSHAQVLMLAPLAFALWWSGVNSGRATRYLAAGIAIGLCMHTYNAGQLVVVVWLASIAVAALVPRLRAAYGAGTALTTVGFALTVTPLAFQVTEGLHFGNQWQEWLSIGRGRQITGEIVERLHTEGAANALELLGNQAAANWLGFFAMPSHAYELGYRNGGMSDDVTAALFLLGIGLCLGSRFGARGAFVLLWWGLTTLLAGVLTRDPPVFQRLVGVLPAVAILAALPVERLLFRAQPSRRRLALTYAAAVLLVSVALWQNWQTYFVEHARQPLDFTSTLARALRDLPPERRVILAGSEYAWHAAGWQQHQFSFQHELIRFDFSDRFLREIGEPAHLLPLRYAAFPPSTIILGPTQVEQLDYLRQLYPSARVRRFGEGVRLGAVVEVSSGSIERTSGLRLARISSAGEKADLGVVNPLVPLSVAACPAGDTCDLEWSGRIYWPTDSPIDLQVVGDGLRQVWLAGVSLPVDAGGSERLQLPRGWQPLRIAQKVGGSRNWSIELRRPHELLPLNRGDFSPDETPQGLLATYSREGQIVGRSIDPQLNYAIDERLFPQPGEPRFRMPFQVRWEGALRIDRPGRYVLRLETNSRGQIEIDGRVVVELAETPATKQVMTQTVTLQLDSGDHPLVANWDAGPPYPSYPRAIFQLFWTPPGGESQLIPPTSFVPRADQEIETTDEHR